MSINLSIKGVPDAIADRLRARAESNHRSLQGELMAIIEEAAADGPNHLESAVANSAERLMRTAIKRGTKTIAQIHAEHLLIFPQPIQGGPLAADIIRADRDAQRDSL